MNKIKAIKARQIIDSRSMPTVEVDIFLEDNSFGRASCPSGASTGATEAKELRDGNPERYNGYGVTDAIGNIEKKIAPHILEKSFDQETLDRTLKEIDGTEKKEHLGANAILAVSLAFAKAMANHHNTPLYQYLGQDFPEKKEMPKGMFNILNGGAHADNGLSFQEFMVVPQQEFFSERLRCAVEIYQSLKNKLSERNLKTAVGDEGGFAPALERNEEALEIIRISAEAVGYTVNKDYFLSLDVAGNEMMHSDRYLNDGEKITREEFISELKSLSERFLIMSIEDPLQENDQDGFIELNRLIGDKVMIVGDDYLVTDSKKIREASENKSVSGVIIKPNQIGTVSETLEAIKTAQANSVIPIISHRSGETEDVTVSHLAIATGAPLVKFGAPARGERVAKYNELLRISEEIDRR